VRKDWTRKWWDNRRTGYELVTSEAVIDELEAGAYEHQQEALNLIAGLRVLPIVDPLGDIIETYIRHQLMPDNPSGDALHLAAASYYCCDFVLTSNCRHLANANKFTHIRHLNTTLGLFVPTLVTPLELLGEDVTP
jgi:PIN domain